MSPRNGSIKIFKVRNINTMLNTAFRKSTGHFKLPIHITQKTLKHHSRHFKFSTKLSSRSPICGKMATFLDVFLPHFKRSLAYGKFFRCLVYEWNEKGKKINLNITPSRICINIWNIRDAAYISFQIANVTLGNYALADKFVGILILTLCSLWLLVRLEFEPDSIPMESLNRLITGLGNWFFIVGSD